MEETYGAHESLVALRVKEAAENLKIGASKTYQLIASGELPAVRIGGSVRVPVDELKAWVQQRVEKNETEAGEELEQG